MRKSLMEGFLSDLTSQHEPTARPGTRSHWVCSKGQVRLEHMAVSPAAMEHADANV